GSRRTTERGSPAPLVRVRFIIPLPRSDVESGSDGPPRRCPKSFKLAWMPAAAHITASAATVTKSGTKALSRTHTNKQRMRSDLDFAVLVDQHYAALYRFAISLAGNESDARDL